MSTTTLPPLTDQERAEQEQAAAALVGTEFTEAEHHYRITRWNRTSSGDIDIHAIDTATGWEEVSVVYTRDLDGPHLTPALAVKWLQEDLNLFGRNSDDPANAQEAPTGAQSAQDAPNTTEAPQTATVAHYQPLTGRWHVEDLDNGQVWATDTDTARRLVKGYTASGHTARVLHVAALTPDMLEQHGVGRSLVLSPQGVNLTTTAAS